MKFDESVKILHVDDDEVDIEAVRRAFKRCKISNTLLHACNGIEALELLNQDESERPAILLVDVNMPKMGGLEFLGKLRQEPKLSHLLVYILTTSNQDSDLFRAHQNNVAGYLVKPTSSAELTEMIRTLHGVWTCGELPNRS